MSNDSQVICPECQTTQSSQAPFCENCGYRIRRSDTVKEGHGAVTADMVARARRRDAQGSSASASPTPGARAQADRGGDDDAESSRTFVEGLHAVDLDEQTDASSASASGEYARADTTTTSIARGPAPDKSGRMIIYMTIWMSLTAVAVLATYFLATHATSGDEATAAAGDVPARVEVAAGPFLRGLDDEVRSFILQMCHRVDDDPGTDCKQDKLLKGEYPQKSIDLPAFQIDATEVSVAAYQSCVDQGDCEAIDYKHCAVWTYQGLQISLRVPKALRESDKPVTCVSLEQARAYCKFAGGRLPTPDQWEKAARGTKGKLFPWGNSWSSNIANWGELDIAQNPIVGKLDGYEWTAPPASYPKGKSPYGAYDMAGNVAEWVESGDKASATARGGSWTSQPFDLRVTGRLELDPTDRRTDVGFRCAYAQ